VTSPFGPLVLIANPRAGRGKVDAALPRVERVLRDEGLDYRIVRTTHPGHATEAARHALGNGERFLVAAGGDGTVHEVVNGMIRNGTPIAPDAVFGVVAAGSGCDFVRTFGLPGDAGSAARRLASGRVRVIDVGTVTCTDGETTRTRYFVNIAELCRPAGSGWTPAALPGRGGRGDPGHDAGVVRHHSRCDPAEGMSLASRVVSRVLRT
jgi:diacylglycerol kinase family enzyme